MPTRTALLDTSAFKCLSRESLSAARDRGWHLQTSPWCFWELLCHLDEGDDFVRAKGNLMKFKGIEIVDKPLDRAIAVFREPELSLVWSSDLTYAALAAIDAAESYSDLANSVLVDEAGSNRGPLKDIAGQIRSTLDKYEAEFQELVSSLIKVLRSEQRGKTTAKRNHDVVMSAVLNGEVPFPDALGLDHEHSSEAKRFTHTYVFWAYVLLQAIWLESELEDTCDTNDLEDGQLCAYVPLDEELWVVAGDKKLRARLSETLDLLKAVGLGERAQFHPATPDVLNQGGPS